MIPSSANRTSKARVDCFPDAPPDWPRCLFSDVAEVNPLYRVATDGEQPFLDMAALREDFGGIAGYGSRPFESSYSRFRKHDTLFAKITPCAENGKVAFVESVPAEHGLGSTEFIVLSPRAGFDPYFVYSLASCPAVHRRAVSRMEGSTGRLRITEKTFTRWLWVAVPPTHAEQTRIAETLKAADDHIRALEELLRKAERVKKALLQSIFVEGIPGRRGTHQTFRWGLAPAGWVETSVRALVTEPVGNGTSPVTARQEPPGFPTLNVSSIRNGRCDQSKVSYIELPEQAATAFAVNQGDFFVLRGNGNRAFVAIGGLLTDEPQAGLVFSDLLIRLRFDHSKALPEFMKYLWQSPPFLRRLQSYAVTGSGLWKIGQRSISRLKVAVPTDIDEQKDIAAIFDAQEELLLALANQLTAARRVKQSLLQNLLTGKLRLKP